MAICAQTGAELKDGRVFAVGRKKDPHTYPLSPEAVKAIPQSCRDEDKLETYQSGGLIVYTAVLVDGELAEESFSFSVSSENRKKYLAKASEKFRFPH